MVFPGLVRVSFLLTSSVLSEYNRSYDGLGEELHHQSTFINRNEILLLFVRINKGTLKNTLKYASRNVKNL